MFTTIFSCINDSKQLKDLAQIIIGQVNEAYQQRAKELLAGAKPATTTATASETPKEKSLVEKVKEAASKMKKGETKTAQAPAKETTKTADKSDVQIAVTDKAAIKKLGLTFEKYSDKCWVLRSSVEGGTKALRGTLKDLKGVYNSRLNGGEGWVFRTKDAQTVADTLGLKVKVA